MSIPNKDEVEGKWEQVKGTVKDKVGEATGDRDSKPKAKHRTRRAKHRKTGADSNAESVMRLIRSVTQLKMPPTILTKVRYFLNSFCKKQKFIASAFLILKFQQFSD